MKRLLVLALALSAVGCTDPRTEVVVVVSTKGVRIPDDVDSVGITVTDLDAPASSQLRFNQTVLLTAGTPSPGTYGLPLTMTLVPGSMHPNDRVRVQVDAIRNSKPVISDAAVFPFTAHQSLRLDFVLYANCIGRVDCSQMDQACGPDGCMPVTPQPLSGEPDLSVSLPDLAPPPPDLMSPPDLTGVTLPDLSGCIPIDCTGRACGSNGCTGTCGPGCTGGATCNEASGTCISPTVDMACSNTCGAMQCGTDVCGHPCGPMGGMCPTGDHCDLTGTCVPNLFQDMSMPMDMSMPDMDMSPSDLSTDGLMTTPCSSIGDICCLGAPNYCKGGLTCYEPMDTCGPPITGNDGGAT